MKHSQSAYLPKDAPESPNIELGTQMVDFLKTASYQQAEDIYEALPRLPTLDNWLLAHISKHDRYFLLTRTLRRQDAVHPWLYDRTREVEADRYNNLDLWARGHYKSTIITFAGTFQEIIEDPEVTIGIFSCTRPIAKAFLQQIQTEAELNPLLYRFWPHIFWGPNEKPPIWGLDSGLVFKRQSNPKEKTVEAWGIVDGQPTSKHFKILLYDDVVTVEYVGTPEMIQKTTDRLELSFNLGTPPEKGGKEIFAGTRYAYGDTYQTMKDRGAIKIREYPATDDGTFDGKPVLLSQESWDTLKQNTSKFTVACLAEGTRIMMDDWTQKAIEDVQVGDKVVGVKSGENGKSGNRTALEPTEVLAVGHRIAEVVEYTFESGKKIIATPDHKWWTGRPPQGAKNDSHSIYKALGFAYHDLRRVCRIVDPDSGTDLTPEQQKIAWWLGGIFDGEGSTSGSRGNSYVHITQCPNHNPDVTQALRDAYTALNFDWVEYERKDGKSASIFRYRGGRKENFRFLQMCDPVRRRKIARTMFGSRIGYQHKEGRDTLVGLRNLGEQRVYSLTTDLGNYIAEGCVSKNCQQLLNPIAGSQQTFDPAHLRLYEIRPRTMNVYILVDPANSKKKGSDRTAIAVVGVDNSFNKFLLDGICHRMTLSQRWDLLKTLRTKWLRQPGVQLVKVGYEKYGMQTDIEHFQEMMKLQNAYFEIVELTWTKDGQQSKQDRVIRLQPDFENWSIFLPYSYELSRLIADLNQLPLPDSQGKNQLTASQQKTLNEEGAARLAKPIIKIDEEGRRYDVCEWFIKNEYTLFPSIHPDFLDVLSRIYDIGITQPRPTSPGELEPPPLPDY